MKNLLRSHHHMRYWISSQREKKKNKVDKVVLMYESRRETAVQEAAPGEANYQRIYIVNHYTSSL